MWPGKKKWGLYFSAKIFRAISKTLVLLALLAVLVAYQSIIAWGQNQKLERAEKSPVVVGHRGAAGLAPENTLAGISSAFEMGVDAVEFDVHLSQDGVVIVYHDFRLKPEITRRADGKWLGSWKRPPVKGLTLAELKKYDVGRLKPYTAYGRRYPDQQPADGERIPTLTEVISLVKSRPGDKTQLWVEIKTSPEKPKISQSPEAVAEAVVRVLRKEKVLERCMILSFDWRSLAHVQKIEPKIPGVYLSHTGRRLNNIKTGQPGPSPWTAGIDVDDFDGSIPHAVKAAGGKHWAPNHKTISANLVEQAHRLELKIYAWTPDSPHQMQRLLDLKVDGIITNRPDILKAILGSKVGN